MLKKIINKILEIFRSNNVFFVGSADKLPEPLSKEDEVKYVMMAMEDDEDARNKLIEHKIGRASCRERV